LVLLYLFWLKATSTDISIEKYLIGRMQFLKDEKHQFQMVQQA